jgi:hypothetical protein
VVTGVVAARVTAGAADTVGALTAGADGVDEAVAPPEEADDPPPLVVPDEEWLPELPPWLGLAGAVEATCATGCAVGAAAAGFRLLEPETPPYAPMPPPMPPSA